MFEMDVRMTKDDEVVVHHDEQLTRCTDAKTKFPGRSSYKVSDFNLEEISRLDAGSWYLEQLELPSAERQPFLQSLTDTEIAEYISPCERSLYGSGSINIPTLAETLCLAKELVLMVNIELKSQPDTDKRLVTAVIKAVQMMKMENQILISSFEHELLKQVRQQTKKISTAVLTGSPIKAPLTYLRKLKVDTYNIGCYQDYKRNGFNDILGKHYLNHIDKIRKAGLSVNIWTCNDPDEMSNLIATGITGLISDYPNRVREEIMNSHKNRTTPTKYSCKVN